MVVNITTCMTFTTRRLLPARSYSNGRGRCKYLSKGGFGGYICKRGIQIESIPRISKDSEICKYKEVLGLA